ncbi:MAG: FkbM family methyltransferase [Pirellulales bacterium]
MLSRILKPWFVFRPAQIFHRALYSLRTPPEGYRELQTSWGASVVADPGKTIGRSICTTGLYDLNVSECLCRLIRPGDLVVDAGANIGYMTLLAAALTTDSGKVIAYEPLGELFQVLQRNVAIAKNFCRRIETRNCALGDQAGEVQLVVPAQMAENDGLSYVGAPASSQDRCETVRQLTLDDEVGQEIVGVLKLDVEGAEPNVLRGASSLLKHGQIRDIVFEDHHGLGSETCRILEGYGYRIFSIGRSLRGLRLSNVKNEAASYEAPSYLATLDEKQVLERCRRPGCAA